MIFERLKYMKTSTKNAIIAAAAAIVISIIGLFGSLMHERNAKSAYSDRSVKESSDSVNTVIFNTGGENINAGRDVNFNK
jgi:H+/gluconate symporter-like permease